jgi:V/A-type H+-transporting ATPase subunit D
VWLKGRLGTAERGKELLNHKLRILRLERQRLAMVEERTAERWERCAREAEWWSHLAGVMAGRRAFPPTEAPPGTDVVLTWGYLMGMTYPVAAVCTDMAGARRAEPGGAALTVAADRHREALVAGVEHAVAVAALRAVDAELCATRRRVRALETRWIPRVRRALADLSLALEELERGDVLRLRWTAASPGRARRADEPGPLGTVTEGPDLDGDRRSGRQV